MKHLMDWWLEKTKERVINVIDQDIWIENLIDNILKKVRIKI